MTDTIVHSAARPLAQPAEDHQLPAAFRTALVWVDALMGAEALDADARIRFAEDYASAIEEIPVNRDPDLPAPTPADFADENWLDYWSQL